MTLATIKDHDGRPVLVNVDDVSVVKIEAAKKDSAEEVVIMMTGGNKVRCHSTYDLQRVEATLGAVKR